VKKDYKNYKDKAFSQEVRLLVLGVVSKRYGRPKHMRRCKLPQPLLRLCFSHVN